MKVRWTPQSLRFPALKGKLMVDTYRGQMRIRAWPGKRGPSKSAEVRRQNTWFKEANQLAKQAEPTQMALAIAMTKGTGLYPRDLLLRQMSGGIYDIITGEGVHYQPRSFFRETTMFQGVILENTVSQALPGSANHTLTWQLPVLDTLGFWDAANPARITIPAGVNVVDVNAGWQSLGNVADITTVLKILLNGLKVASSGQRVSNIQSSAIPTGPLTVAVTDVLEVELFHNKTTATIAGRQTRFCLNILDAD